MLDKGRSLMQLRKIQSQLAKEAVEVEAGNGAVRVKISGDQKIKKIEIDEARVNPDDLSQLERWLENAITQAITKSQQIAAEKMREISGGLGIPGL